MPVDSTQSIAMVKLLVHSGKQHGLSAETVLALVGLQPARLEDPDGRVPRLTVYKLWKALAEAVGDPDLGLSISQNMPQGVIGLVEYVARNSATVGEAFEAAARYVRIIHDGGVIEIERRPTVFTLAHRIEVDPLGAPRANADWILAHLVIRGRDYTGVDFAPRLVEFHHRRPTDVRRYLEIFRSVPRFEAECNRLTFDAAVYDLPIKQADPNLLALMAHYAEQQLAQLPEGESFPERMQRVISELIVRGVPRLGDVARALGVSSRTLQRRLRGEETSFQAQVTDVRKQMAQRYLSDPQLSINEIAFMLGYSEPSAFHRSFKKWLGVTPRSFRLRAA